MKTKLEKLEPKLEFRPHGREDIDWRMKWLNDDEVRKYLGDASSKQTSREEQEKWMDAYLGNPQKKFFTIKYENKPVGLLGFNDISKESGSAELFIMLGESEVRGKGLGRKSMEWMIEYGFKDLGLNKLELGVLRKNIPAVRLYEKLGFKKAADKSDDNELWMQLEKKH